MARSGRRSHPALIDHLFARPRAYTLFQAIRLLERMGARAAQAGGREPPDPVGRGTDPRRAAVAIRASVPLAFAGAEVAALARSDKGPPELTQTVIGLTGATGVLPHAFSEIVQANIRERELGLRAFLDLFNTRAAGLLYDAWAKYRLAIEHERIGLPGTRAPIDGLLGAIIGIGLSSLRQRMTMHDATAIHFCGLLGQRIRSAQAVDQILTGALGYPIRIEQYRGAWMPIAPADQTCLPDGDRPQGAFCRLGAETVAGSRVWDVEASVCLVVGPLAYRDFLSFLPNGLMGRYLIDLATFTLGPEIAIHTRIVLKPEEVPPGRVGADPRAAPDGRLGLNTWLGWEGRRKDPGVVEFQPASPLR